jgi:hypothetical protein
MATPAQNRQSILDLIKYLEVGSAGRASIDDRVAVTLANIYGSSCGFKCGCPGSLIDGLRESPISTLLRLLTCTDAIAVAAAGGASGVELLPSALSGFAVLGGSTVTNTGATSINGDLGLSAGTSVTGFPPGTISGVSHVTDAAAAAAQVALTATYNQYAGMAATATVAGDLAGQTLLPGVYKSTSTLAVGPGAGNLTLDAAGDLNALWVFQVASALTINNGKSIVLANGAKADRVFWQVGSSATLGTTTLFKGNIMALTSITATTGATIIGRLLAQNGAVTLDTNNITIGAP